MDLFSYLLGKKKGGGGGTINLQEKTLNIPPTVNEYTVTADDGYDGLSKVNVNVELPYTRLLYIETTGTQYIDTGYKPSDKTNITATAYVTDFTLYRNAICGVTDGTNERFQITYTEENPSTHANFLWGYSNIVRLPSFDTSNNLLNIHNNGNTVYVNNDNTVATSPTTPFTCRYSLYLFGTNVAGELSSTSLSAGIRIYEFKIFEKNTDNNYYLVHHYIPVIRKSDNEVCLYDTVDEVYLTNAGTGNFIAGYES